MKKIIAKSKRPEAERAAEWVCMELLGCTHTRRALRTKFAKVDFFGCDVIGVRADGRRVWVQVTAGQVAAVLTRRKKLEAYPWHPTDQVFVWQLVERQDIANPSSKEWFFRVWEYQYGTWTDNRKPIKIDKKWFKAYKSI